MYERMLDKSHEPSQEEIAATIGEDASRRLCALEDALAAQYRLARELRFPFGNNYGWGYKYSHGTFHLCYAFFEKGAFTVMVQVGDRQVPALEKVLDTMSPQAQRLWESRYPCGERGGWVRYRILAEEDLHEALKFVYAKKAPAPQR